MRPPAKQAENQPEKCFCAFITPCFNEAACKTGGKRELIDQYRTGFISASMRPPAKQAENAGCHATVWTSGT